MFLKENMNGFRSKLTVWGSMKNMIDNDCILTDSDCEVQVSTVNAQAAIGKLKSNLHSNCCWPRCMVKPSTAWHQQFLLRCIIFVKPRRMTCITLTKLLKNKSEKVYWNSLHHPCMLGSDLLNPTAPRILSSDRKKTGPRWRKSREPSSMKHRLWLNVNSRTKWDYH